MCEYLIVQLYWLIKTRKIESILLLFICRYKLLLTTIIAYWLNTCL